MLFEVNETYILKKKTITLRWKRSPIRVIIWSCNMGKVSSGVQENYLKSKKKKAIVESKRNSLHAWRYMDYTKENGKLTEIAWENTMKLLGSFGFFDESCKPQYLSIPCRLSQVNEIRNRLCFFIRKKIKK